MNTTTRRWPFGGFLLGLLLGVAGQLLALLLVWLLLRGDLAVYGNKTAWYVARSTGTVAYLLLSGATVWGVLLTSKLIKDTVPAPLALGMHSFMSWLGVALGGFHGFVLLFDGYYNYRLIDLLLPFTGPYRPLWVGLGVIGFYLALLTSASFVFRRWLGTKRWRALHYLTYVSYLFVTLHGLMAGTDSGQPGMRAMYIGSALLVLFLTNYRLLAARH
jgi:DMSO/TMAO reductase YedYZ heme-binding membrane subunit